MISKEDFMNADKFPLTTQGGLDYSGQQLINAFNYDSLVGYAKECGELSDDQKAIIKELEIKLERNFGEETTDALDDGNLTWEDVEASQKDKKLQDKHPIEEANICFAKEKSCEECRFPAEKLSWFYF